MYNRQAFKIAHLASTSPTIKYNRITTPVAMIDLLTVFVLSNLIADVVTLIFDADVFDAGEKSKDVR